jgi:ferritin
MHNKPIAIMPKSIIPPKVLSQLQRQLNHELNAAHAYQALSIWCAVQNLGGFARFFAKQAGEERVHAQKFIDHLVNRNTPAVLAALPAPKQDFPSLLAVAKQALAMEQGNTRGINTVFEAAVAAKDYPAQVLLHWFINEQVEEENWATELIDRVERATCAGSRDELDRHIEKILAGE